MGAKSASKKDVYFNVQNVQINMFKILKQRLLLKAV